MRSRHCSERDLLVWDQPNAGRYWCRNCGARGSLRAHANLQVPYNPEPLEYLHQRGMHDATVRRHLLGYGLHDPQTLVAHLQDVCPELLPYGEAAGVLVRDRDGSLCAHWTLCGCLVFPYTADGDR